MTNRFRFWLPSVACGKPRRYLTVINNNNHNHSIIIRNSIPTYNATLASHQWSVSYWDLTTVAAARQWRLKRNRNVITKPIIARTSCLLAVYYWYTYIPIEILDFRWRRRREWMIIDKSSASQASWEAVSSIRIGRYKTTMSVLYCYYYILLTPLRIIYLYT